MFRLFRRKPTVTPIHPAGGRQEPRLDRVIVSRERTFDEVEEAIVRRGKTVKHEIEGILDTAMADIGNATDAAVARVREEGARLTASRGRALREMLVMETIKQGPRDAKYVVSYCETLAAYIEGSDRGPAPPPIDPVTAPDA